MNRSPLRSLLRHIALGTPLVLGSGGVLILPGLVACGTCPPSTLELVEHTITDEIRTSEGEARSCEAICAELDGRPPERCERVDEHTVACSQRVHVSCGAGRLPIAHSERRSAAGSTVRQRWLLEMGTLELAAVAAFDELAHTLARHGAPRALTRRARRASQDEMRHARALVALAREDGPARVEVRTSAGETPTLLALALHNAREGCVHEALGALDAAHQAMHAPDADFRRAMAAIARDEARHALFSLDLDAWARTRLSPRERAAMDEATGAAVRALAETDDEVVPEVGLFGRPERVRLLAA